MEKTKWIFGNPIYCCNSLSRSKTIDNPLIFPVDVVVTEIQQIPVSLQGTLELSLAHRKCSINVNYY